MLALCLVVWESVAKLQQRHQTGGLLTVLNCCRSSYSCQTKGTTLESTSQFIFPWEVPKYLFAWCNGNWLRIPTFVYFVGRHLLLPTWKRKLNGSGEQLSPFSSQPSLAIQPTFLLILLWIRMFSRKYYYFQLIICYCRAKLIDYNCYFLFSVFSSYLVMNAEKRRSLSSLSPHSSSGDVHSHLTTVRKRDILRTFYKTIVGTMINLPSTQSSGLVCYFFLIYSMSQSF